MIFLGDVFKSRFISFIFSDVYCRGNTLRDTGLLLIHLVTAGVGMLEKLKDTLAGGKRRPSEAFGSPDQVIALHRFGSSTGAGGEGSAGDATAATNILSDAYKRRVASLNGESKTREFNSRRSNKTSLSRSIVGSAVVATTSVVVAVEEARLRFLLRFLFN